MSAVKPTAEDYEKAITAALTELHKYGSPRREVVTLEGLSKAAKILASRRQPESALDGARNARSVETEADPELIERLADGIEHNPHLVLGIQFCEQASKALRAYAKLLRGEK